MGRKRRVMNRRDFLRSTGGFAAAATILPRVVHAQTQKIPKIGVLWHAGSREEEGAYFPALLQGFRDLGYIEGRTIIFEHRYANEQYDRFPGQVAELIGLNVDVLIASI